MQVVQATIEKEFLRSLLEDPKHFNLAILKKVKPHFFIEEKDQPLNTFRVLYTALLKYYLKYQNAPTAENLARVLTHSPHTEDRQKKLLTYFTELHLSPLPEAPFPLLIDELKKNYTNFLLQQGVRESLDCLERNDTDKTLQTLKHYLFKIDTETQEDISEGTIAASAPVRARNYQELKNNPAKHLGIPTGFPTYDASTGGLKPGELIVIAAKSSEGKSCLLLNMSYNMAVHSGKNVLFVSVEMPKVQVERRFDARDAGISHERLKFGQLTQADEKKYMRVLEKQRSRKGHLYIYDIPSACTPAILEAKIQELSAQYTFDVIVVDYLNIVQPDEPSKSSWEDQGNVARDLRKIARTQNIPLLTAVQINREGMKGKKDKYEQQHIALSQFIVNHSDVILSMKVIDPDVLEVGDVCEINCSFIKNRDGARKSFQIIAAFDQQKMEEPILTTHANTGHSP